jgi:hypothetical protein
MGFGLMMDVVLDNVTAGARKSTGRFGWSGAFGTSFWADRKEKRAAVLMIQTPGGTLRADFENAVMQAIIDWQTIAAGLARSLQRIEILTPRAQRGRDGRGQQVFKYTLDGRLVMTLGTAGVSGEGPDTFNEPTDVAVAPNGDIFVADGHVNSRIVKVSRKTAAFRSSITTAGSSGNGRSSDRRAASSSPRRHAVTSSIAATRRRCSSGSAKDGSIKYAIEETLAEGVAVDLRGNIYVGETVDGKTNEGVVTGHTVRKLIRK